MNTMPPFWKIKRELRRVGDQIIGLPRTLAMIPSRMGEPQRRREHDAAFPRNLRIQPGLVAPSTDIAVYVLYQPQGLSRSSISTCKWLSSTGHATLAVSNAPLSPHDRQEIAPFVWQIVERENFGYDFGAYRDGIRLAGTVLPVAKRLLLLNDSIWLFHSDELYRTVTAVNKDLAGLLQDEKVIHESVGSRSSEKLHVESYFLSVTQNLLNSKTFERFWSDYEMTDDKSTTIKRGEIGWSRAVKEGGFSLGAVLRREDFLAQLENISTQKLRLALDYAAYDDRVFLAQNRLLRERFETTHSWRQEAVAHIRAWTYRRRFNAGFPLINEWMFGTLFLKKSREPIFQEARRAYLRALSDGLLKEPSPEIRSEIEASVPNWRR